MSERSPSYTVTMTCGHKRNISYGADPHGTFKCVWCPGQPLRQLQDPDAPAPYNRGKRKPR